MVEHHLEVERKYEFVGGDGEPTHVDWSALDGYSVQKPVEEHLEASYFDTADNDLSRNLVALRRRLGGYDQGWHIKFDDRAGARHEMHFDLLADEMKMPAQVSKFVRSVTLGDELHEIVSLITDRIRTVLKDSNGVSVAEICQDAVHAHDFSTGIERQWNEWEIELLESGEKSPAEIFADCEKILFEAGAKPSKSPAKIARALGQDGEFEARRQGKNLSGEQLAKKTKKNEKKNKRRVQDTAPQDSSELLQHVLHMLTSNLMLWELKFRAGTPETVHGMRIGTRQVQSVLRYAVRPYVKNEVEAEAVEQLISSLKKLMKGLSSARDIDILTDFLGSVEVRPGLVSEKSREELEEYLALDDEDASKSVLRLLDSEEYLKLRVALIELTQNLDMAVTLPLNAENFVNKVAKRIRKHLSSFLKADYKDLWELNPSAFAYDEVHNDVLFEIRRDAQAARYCLEAFEIAGIKLSKDHKKLRNYAGELHREISILSDENVVVRWLERSSRRAMNHQSDRLGIGYLLGRSSYYAVGLRMTQHSFVPAELKRIKKLDLK